jgi:hypothetical protein
VQVVSCLVRLQTVPRGNFRHTQHILYIKIITVENDYRINTGCAPRHSILQGNTHGVCLQYIVDRKGGIASPNKYSKVAPELIETEPEVSQWVRSGREGAAALAQRAFPMQRGSRANMRMMGPHLYRRCRSFSFQLRRRRRRHVLPAGRGVELRNVSRRKASIDAVGPAIIIIGCRMTFHRGMRASERRGTVGIHVKSRNRPPSTY